MREATLTKLLKYMNAISKIFHDSHNSSEWKLKQAKEEEEEEVK